MAASKREFDEDWNVRDALFRLEPEIRLLDGVVTALRLLGEAPNSVEPIALSALAHSGITAMRELKLGLRQAMEAAHIDTGAI
jgi:hypothetical protein